MKNLNNFCKLPGCPDRSWRGEYCKKHKKELIKKSKQYERGLNEKCKKTSM